VSNLRKLIVILAVIVGMLVVFAAIKTFERKDDSMLKIYNEYKEKGKESQFTPEDVRKSFGR
jgi:dimeric dUTPase (all-alpha-NTP-PPase superfamily)